MEARMKVSPRWLASSAASFELDEGRVGCAQLSHYTATFHEWGDGPPLVIIPGMAGGIDLIAPLARKLAYHFRVIAFQLRGEDDPFVLRRRFGLTDLVDDIAEFLDWQQLERPDVLGVSFGGVLGLECAIRYPHRFRSLSVHGAGARFESGIIKSVAGHVLTDYPLPSHNAFVNQFFQLLMGKGPQPAELVERVAGLCWRTDQSVMTHRFRLIRRLNLVPRLHRVRVPVMAMAAERDVLVSCSSLQDLCDHLQTVKFVKLPRGGHLSFVVDPVRVAREVINFSEELE
jgi:pimeloyl-ACP methyl ester carboxylesterase